MQDAIFDRARDLGRLLGQTGENQALLRAQTRIGEDPALVELLNRMASLEQRVTAVVQQGGTPDAEQREEYERVFSELQASATYQGLVAAQANFDRVLGRVNDEIARGMEMATQSRIILPS